MVGYLATLINLLVNALTLLVIVDVLISYFLPPYHPSREMLDRLVEPFLAPIRRFLPPAGGIDFSPMVLVIAIQLIGQVLISILRFLV